jgi:hypothetical protein
MSMDERASDRELIAKFGTELAKIHGGHVADVKRQLEKIANPNSEYEHAVADYYRGFSRDQLIVTLAQSAIEGVLHDLFFLFDEHEEFKLVLKHEDGSEIDLARAVDVIQAFPMDWFEKASSAGHETGRFLEFLSKRLPEETRQERRARILAEKAGNTPK